MPLNDCHFNTGSVGASQTLSRVVIMITLAGINYLEFALAFSLVYSADLGHLHGASSYAFAAYMSFMTQLAVGYSDVYPTGWLRIVSVIQALMTLAFVLLVLGRFIASLPRMQSVFDKDPV